MNSILYNMNVTARQKCLIAKVSFKYCTDRQTDTQTDRQTDRQTEVIYLSVIITHYNGNT